MDNVIINITEALDVVAAEISETTTSVVVMVTQAIQG